MTEKEFQKIINDEIKFHGKKFVGDTKDEQIDHYKMFINRYYESLGYLSEKGLEMAFRKCREQFEYFPKVNQLLKFCPVAVMKKSDNEIDYTSAIPMTPRMKEQLSKMKSGPSKIKLGREMMESMKAMCQGRFGGNWSETFARWDKENDARMD